MKAAWFAIGLVVLAIVGLVAVKLVGSGSSTATAKPSSLLPAPVSATIAAQVTGVPAATLNTVGVGTGVTPPQRLAGLSSLSKGGVPRVVYIGAEYCPFCAAERWALIGALSRFGTFTRLGATTSSAVDVYPSTPTLSFYGSTYHSSYLHFSAVEEATNQPVGSSYQPLQTPTTTEQHLLTKLDAPPYVAAANTNAIPFLDLANRYLQVGASYSPSVLQGHSRSQIAAALSNPASPIAQTVDGTANELTAALCTLTHGQPGSVCTSPSVRAAAHAVATAPKVG